MKSDMQGYIYSLYVEKKPQSKEELKNYLDAMPEAMLDEDDLEFAIGKDDLELDDFEAVRIKFHFPGVIMVQTVYKDREAQRDEALSMARTLAILNYPLPIYSAHDIIMSPEPLVTSKDGLVSYILHSYVQEHTN